jgi:hypothetical protein
MPEERNQSDWERVLADMQAEQDVVLSPEENERIYRYLVTARRTTEVASK